MSGEFPERIQEPKYPQYTNLALNDGLADQLMALVNHHLEKVYDQGKISGSDYATIYVGSINSVLQFTTQYLLGTMLIDEQKAKAVAETSLLGKQEDQIDGQLALIELQKAELRYRIEELLPLEKQKLEIEVLKLNQEKLLIAAQILKINAEVLFIDAQKDMMLKQALKIDKEIEFLNWKIETEKANTVGGVADSDSLVGRQMDLLVAQKLGFAGDLQVKTGKVYADYDAVVESVNENGVAILGTQATRLLGQAESTAAAI